MEEGSLFSHFVSVLSFSSFLKNFHIKRDLHDVVIFKSSFEPCLGVRKSFLYFCHPCIWLTREVQSLDQSLKGLIHHLQDVNQRVSVIVLNIQPLQK
jgi:hypothetical protein